MHDDGSPPLADAPDRVARVRRLARALRTLLAVSAAVGALPLVSLAALAGPAPALPYLSLGLSFALSLAWISWLHEGRLLLDDLGIRSPISGLTRAWAVFMLMPCVWMPLLLWSVHHLARASDPARLPPVVVERVSTSGGFRDDPVVRVATGRVARPVLALWVGSWALSLLVFPALIAGSSPGLFLLLEGVTSLASALAAWQIVGAVTHNLAELQRRERARAG